MKINELITGRTSFNESFLYEDPELVSADFAATQIENDITELKGALPDKVQNLGNDLFRLDCTNEVYFWIEKNNQFVIGTSLDKKPNAWIVGMTGKNSKFKNQSPYASDLYLEILRSLKGTNQNIIISDNKMSQAGYGIWNKLFNLGHKVSIYDPTKSGTSYVRFDNEEEMKQYFGSEKHYGNYRYVLSESKEAQYDIFPSFKLRKYRELIDSIED